MIELRGVVQSYRTGFWMKRSDVLHGVDLDIPRGSVFGFLGANGAGKTTLIQLIVGLRKPTQGSVKVAGLDASLPDARAKIGYLPERPYFYDHLTGEGLLRYFGVLSGMSSEKIASRIPQALETVGMSDARKVELKRYSKGMLQRIGIAQALMHEPELLVLDEPMSGLDPLGRKEMRELILKLRSENRTVFFSSHVIPDVEAICDRVALIQKGRIIGCGPIGELLSKGSRLNEVAVTGIDEARVRAAMPGGDAKLDRIPDGWRATLSGQEAVAGFLKEVLSHGARVLWVQPVRQSLESLFE